MGRWLNLLSVSRQRSLVCLLQVYKRKTEAAKKEYLKALAAYKANQLSQVRSSYHLEENQTSFLFLKPPSPQFSPQPNMEEMEAAPSSPPKMPTYAATQQAPCPSNILEECPITNPCGSSIILNVPEMKTHFSTGADKAAAPAAAPPATKITKIIIPKHVLQAGAQLVTVLPGGVGTFQPALVVSGAPRQPPPLQQMQNAPPPPRLQQMAPAPPPLQAKPREGGALSVLPLSFMATSPPPLQIKIVPASIQDKDSLPIIVPDTDVSPAAGTSAQAAPLLSAQRPNSAAASGHAGEVAHGVSSGEVNVTRPGPNGRSHEVTRRVAG